MNIDADVAHTMIAKQMASRQDLGTFALSR